MSGTRAIPTTSRRELSSSFCFLQGKAPKKIHAILTETLSCFLPGRAKDLSAPQCDLTLWLVSVMFIPPYLLGYTNSLMPLNCKRTLVWRLDGAGNIKTYVGLHTKFSIFSPDLNQIWIFSTDFS